MTSTVKDDGDAGTGRAVALLWTASDVVDSGVIGNGAPGLGGGIPRDSAPLAIVARRPATALGVGGRMPTCPQAVGSAGRAPTGTGVRGPWHLGRPAWVDGVASWW